jgi:predicted nuclease of predicted toxin-antitoxin system
MAVALYTDHHVSRAIVSGLRLRGVDILTAYEDGSSEIDDPSLLDRAAELGRILFTQDSDLLAEAKRRQAAGISFTAVIYAHQRNVSIGTCIHDLEIITQVSEPGDLDNRVTYLPL